MAISPHIFQDSIVIFGKGAFTDHCQNIYDQKKPSGMGVSGGERKAAVFKQAIAKYEILKKVCVKEY